MIPGIMIDRFMAGMKGLGGGMNQEDTPWDGTNGVVDPITGTFYSTAGAYISASEDKGKTFGTVYESKGTISAAFGTVVAARNVADHGLQERVLLHRGDLYAPVAGKRYDLIIANPPYVDAEGMAGLPHECRTEPKLAFDGGADGLEVVRLILDQASHHLMPEGGLLCEIGRCRSALELAYPQAEFLWLDTEDSEGEVFWATASDLSRLRARGDSL